MNDHDLDAVLSELRRLFDPAAPATGRNPADIACDLVRQLVTKSVALEREACAALADEEAAGCGPLDSRDRKDGALRAADIRARGKQ